MDFLGVKIIPANIFNPNPTIMKAKDIKTKDSDNTVVVLKARILANIIRVRICVSIVMLTIVKR